jgi:hypothetical protein
MLGQTDQSDDFSVLGEEDPGAGMDEFWWDQLVNLPLPPASAAAPPCTARDA